MSSVTICTLLIHVAATLSMVGVIWFVQVVHYPLFSRVGKAEFHQYETDHQRLTSIVVVPWMLAELVSAVMLIWFRPDGVSAYVIWLGLALLAAIWFSTFGVQVPQHAALALSYDPDTHNRLVSGNWFRTVAWSARGLLVLWMVGQAIATVASGDR